MPHVICHTESMREKSAETLARNLNLLRSRRGVSEREVAAGAGVDPKTINRVAKVFNCTLDVLDRIADYFGEPVVNLLLPEAGRAKLAERDLQGYEGYLVMLYRKADDEKRAKILSCAEGAEQAAGGGGELSPDARDLAEAFERLPAEDDLQVQVRMRLYAALKAAISDPGGALSSSRGSRPVSEATLKLPRGRQKHRD
jgi:transcriptional regulator with XRE-family HTH domain